MEGICASPEWSSRVVPKSLFAIVILSGALATLFRPAVVAGRAGAESKDLCVFQRTAGSDQPRKLHTPLACQNGRRFLPGH